MAAVLISLLHSLRFLVRSHASLHLEAIALRHQGYIASYMQSRTHLALEKDAPISHQLMPLSSGPIIATPEVGGLQHRCDRAAA